MAAPTEESNISPSPFWLHELSSESAVVNFSRVPSAEATEGRLLPSGVSSVGAVTFTDVSSWTPLVSRNAREKSTIFLPLYEMTSLPESVTSATWVHSRFSLSHSALK